MTPQPCVLLKYGELALKGRNRGRFERHLLRNLEHAVSTDAAPARVWRREGVLVVLSDLPQDELVARAREVIGISLVQPALRVARNPRAAAAGALRLLRDRFGSPDSAEPRRFAIRARRRSKRFPMNSEQLAAAVGQRVCEEWGWPVDLSHPEVEIAVEVDEREVFVALDRHRGQGGLPVGSSGRVLALLSGGYDSPVAAYRAMRRGLRCDFVHFTGAPYTDPSSTYKAYALVRQLDRFQGDSQLHVVPIGTAQRELATAGAGQLQIVAQRRLMVRVAEALALRLGAQALVSGDSLGQVASQTLSNLVTVERAASSLPLLRPLLAWDKDEIMAESRRLGLADISTLPDEDCCQLLTPPNVATRTTADELAHVEGRLDLDELVDKLLANAQVHCPAADPRTP
ncbi:thiamine biosynthesis protein ThiI [Amycolatopsis arida]|uniref:Probable tRNA sulfurtransferase n=1 Tax=Amycolatopsis arida TaxID=587909 RepID=A0A1I5LV24_9PSEU|nr:tRNA uracil 4-sulfurtransferase ThiI [Amycolatopsis arida]TDX93862.1 thiamine biosynthesis protein ThiI [Amycolatopsis arida]SFP01199.1 thiamine biosynthesis protein ThiI [Amycolatopsis arida]